MRPFPGGSARVSATSDSGQEGFTLVELLVVVLVLGALVGIAVPTFVDQRKDAWDAAVRSELRTAMIALESSRAQNGSYTAGALGSDAGWGYQSSASVQLAYRILPESYCLMGWFVPTSDAGSAQNGFLEVPDAPDAFWRAQADGVIRVADVGDRCPS